MKESFEGYNTIKDGDKSMPEYRTDLRVLEIVIDDLLNTIMISRNDK